VIDCKVHRVLNLKLFDFAFFVTVLAFIYNSASWIQSTVKLQNQFLYCSSLRKSNTRICSSCCIFSGSRNYVIHVVSAHKTLSAMELINDGLCLLLWQQRVNALNAGQQKHL